jgi:hypothetical protein
MVKQKVLKMSGNEILTVKGLFVISGTPDEDSGQNSEVALTVPEFSITLDEQIGLMKEISNIVRKYREAA